MIWYAAMDVYCFNSGNWLDRSLKNSSESWYSVIIVQFGAYPVFVVDGTPSSLKSQARAVRFFRASGLDLSSFPVVEEGVSVKRNSRFVKYVEECVVRWVPIILLINLYLVAIFWDEMCRVLMLRSLPIWSNHEAKLQHCDVILGSHLSFNLLALRQCAGNWCIDDTDFLFVV